MKTLEQIRLEIKKIPASQAKRHDKIKEVLFELCELIELIQPEWLNKRQSEISTLENLEDVQTELDDDED